MASPLQSFRLPPALAARIDAWALKAGIPSRGGAIVALITQALDASEKPAPAPRTPAKAAATTRTPSPDAPEWMRRGFTSGRWR